MIPEAVIIGPYRYRVQIEESSFLDEAGTAMICGQVKHDQCLIRIKRADPMVMLVTLWHEVIHAIDALVDGDMSEEEVERFAPALVAFLQRNPITVPVA